MILYVIQQFAMETHHFEKREVIELNGFIFIFFLNVSLSTADFDYGPTPRLARGALKTW